jgi:uncharacterized membrane protein YkvA (DUF1232 family)
MANVPFNILTRIAAMAKYAVAVFRARETPLYVKLLLGGGLIYAISPWDLIPEWVPVIGILDDFALAALLIAWANSFQVSTDGIYTDKNDETDD